MHRILLALVVVCGLELGGPCGAFAQSAGQRDSQELDFQFVRSGDGSIRVANGKGADAEAWGTLVFADFIGDGGRVRCSGALVAEDVLLTSAHCLDADGAMRIVYLKLGPAARIELECDPYPDYMRSPYVFGGVRGPMDFALCYIPYPNGAPEAIASLRFEVIDLSPAPRAGESVMLSGFGCTQLRDNQGELVGVDLTQTALHVDVDTVEADTGSGFIETRAHWRTEAALCYGDSGGPLLSGVTLNNQNGPRRIRGVNSDVRPEVSAPDYVRSRFARVSAPGFAEWARRWARPASGAERLICGVNPTKDSMTCRP